MCDDTGNSFGGTAPEGGNASVAITPEMATIPGTSDDQCRGCGKADIEVGQTLCQACRDCLRLVAGTDQTKCPQKPRRAPAGARNAGESKAK